MPGSEFREVSNDLAQPPLRDLLALSVGSPTTERLAALANDYAIRSQMTALALCRRGVPVGLIGWEGPAEGVIEIRNLAVSATHRRDGIGRHLIREAAVRTSAREIVLETDGDAIEFYRRCGFTIRSLGKKYPGVERFACTFRPDADPDAESSRLSRTDRLGSG